MHQFDQIFKKREFNELIGDSRQDLYILIVILFVTFAALAHIFGGQKELRLRMANPYSNWVNIPVGKVSGRNISQFVNDLQESSVLDSFNILDAGYYQINWLKALKESLNQTSKIRLRSIDFESPVADAILGESNVLHKTSYERGQCHAIVSEAVLKELEYFEFSSSMFLPVYENSYDDYKLILLIPISHVVKTLPDNVDMVVSDVFMSLLNSNVEKSNFLNQEESRIITFFATERKTKEELIIQIPDSLEIAEINYNEFELNGKEFVKHRVKLYTKLHFLEILEIQKRLIEHGTYSYIDFYCNENVDYDIHEHYYALNFKSLSKIKEFRDYAKNKYDINISLAQVESKNNFYLISQLAKLFIYLLIGFAMFSITLFIQSIIKNHLNKIKPILGTLKAFGLRDRKIINLYMKVIFDFYGIASLFALFMMIVYHIFQNLAGLNMFFDLFNIYLLLVWACLSLLLFLFLYNYMAHILFKSPGDLVYNR